jgi:putative PIN family toxin of toxin-antitoxin system
MIRVVLDTNVVVSSALTRGGAEAYVLDLAVKRLIQVYVLPEVLTEYEEVLRRPKFRRLEPAVVESVLARIRQSSLLVSPRQRLAVSPDEEDNRFLECAQASEAHYLVTGDKRHFPNRWRKTRIVNAREFIEAIAALPAEPPT